MCSGGVTYTRTRLLSLESQQKVWLRGAHGEIGKVSVIWDTLKNKALGLKGNSGFARTKTQYSCIQSIFEG